MSANKKLPRNPTGVRISTGSRQRLIVDGTETETMAGARRAGGKQDAGSLTNAPSVPEKRPPAQKPTPDTPPAFLDIFWTGDALQGRSCDLDGSVVRPRSVGTGTEMACERGHYSRWDRVRRRWERVE